MEVLSEISFPSVIRAKDLPRVKNLVGKKRQFFVTVTSGTTTKETEAVRSVEQAVRWDETLEGLWVVYPPLYSVNLTEYLCSAARPSSHLTVYIYAKRSIGKDILAGMLEIPLDAFLSSSQSSLSLPRISFSTS